jgi:hypothetical protein
MGHYDYYFYERLLLRSSRDLSFQDSILAVRKRTLLHSVFSRYPRCEKAKPTPFFGHSWSVIQSRSKLIFQSRTAGLITNDNCKELKQATQPAVVRRMDEYFVNAQTKQSTDATKPKDLTNYFVTYSSRGASTRGELTIYTRREREVRSEKRQFYPC